MFEGYLRLSELGVENNFVLNAILKNDEPWGSYMGKIGRDPIPLAYELSDEDKKALKELEQKKNVTIYHVMEHEGKKIYLFISEDPFVQIQEREHCREKKPDVIIDGKKTRINIKASLGMIKVA